MRSGNERIGRAGIDHSQVRSGSAGLRIVTVTYVAPVSLTFLCVCSAPSWNGQRDELRTAHDAVAREQRNVVHDTGGGDELVRWIALEIESGGGAGNSKIERPYVYAV